MGMKTWDTAVTGTFPSPPTGSSEFLIPISSWVDMFLETQVTNVEFDQFWYESIEEGVAYFFKWLGQPRSTVLVVWTDEGPTHIECRKVGDVPASDADSEPIIEEITQLFRDAGYWRGESSH